jgi:hypothetical protein
MRNFFAGTHGGPTWRKAGRDEGFRVIGERGKGWDVRRLGRHWGEVRTFAGVEPDAPAMGIARGMRALPAELPDDPTPEQVDAWLELASLATDSEFQRRVREIVLAGGTAQALPEGTDYRIVSKQSGRAVADGMDPGSDAGREILDMVVLPGTPRPERERLLAQLETFTDERVERYWQLLGILNGRPPFTPMVPAFRCRLRRMRFRSRSCQPKSAFGLVVLWVR